MEIVRNLVPFGNKIHRPKWVSWKYCVCTVRTWHLRSCLEYERAVCRSLAVTTENGITFCQPKRLKFSHRSGPRNHLSSHKQYVVWLLNLCYRYLLQKLSWNKLLIIKNNHNQCCLHSAEVAQSETHYSLANTKWP